MQNDLISRSALKEAMCFVAGDTTCPMHIAAEIDQIIDCAPAVDAVEVVRCKDCKRCDGFPKMEIEEDEVGICKVTRMVVFPDFFCNYGERRADDG